ncbi:MgtC/SapB family protein [Cellvibrio mixtus]|uniref:MgtC/SapB family protein n=1 Tax=Cellvibrio mixtus TaxID=39650 RepID=UPI000587C999|nr:MgtC/SapB family protein [Cellvibrio mixtus]
MVSFDVLVDIAPFDWASIGTSLLCGSIIGMERQLRGKPVGIRTSSLITLGTYIFIAASLFAASHFSGPEKVVTDPSRIIGQVITGIGFLGAGVMLARDGFVLGVTSAATIWALASIGVVIAIGYNLVAIKLSLVVIAVLVGVDLLEDYSQAFTRGVHKKYQDWRGKNKNSSD